MFYADLIYTGNKSNYSYERCFNLLPNDKSLDFTKLKAFADDKQNVAKMKFVRSDRVEITAGSIFSFSSSVFQSLLL